MTVAAQGAQVKKVLDDGEKVIRILFDGTHGSEINPKIRQRDHAETTQAADLSAVIAALAGEKCGLFGMTADAESAHQVVAVHPEDWPLQACAVEKPSGPEVDVYVHMCGTYGIASIAYWWACLAALLGRIYYYLLRLEHPPGSSFSPTTSIG